MECRGMHACMREFSSLHGAPTCETDRYQTSNTQERARSSSDTELSNEWSGYEVHHVHKKLPLKAMALGPNDQFYYNEVSTKADRRGFWPRGLPSQSLMNRLRGRQKSLPGVIYLSMGWEAEDGHRNERCIGWFICFDDGSYSWSTTDDQLDTYLDKLGDAEIPAFLCAAHGSWVLRTNDFIAFSNNLQVNTRSVLDELLDDPDESGNLQKMALGPEGECFVLSTSGHF
eukprot:365987-Chlamydomonas_euryale.AAC.25